MRAIWQLAEISFSEQERRAGFAKQPKEFIRGWTPWLGMVGAGQFEPFTWDLDFLNALEKKRVLSAQPFYGAIRNLRAALFTTVASSSKTDGEH